MSNLAKSKFPLVEKEARSLRSTGFQFHASLLFDAIDSDDAAQIQPALARVVALLDKAGALLESAKVAKLIS